MFFAAEAALLDVEVAVSTHKGVHAMFGKHFVQPGTLPTHLGRDLVQVFNARQSAEYESNMARTRDEAEHILRKAERFVGAVKEHLRA